MYPFDYPHNCYNPRNCNAMPISKEDDQHSSPHFNYPPYPSTFHPPSYYHYGPPHLPYVQPPPAPLPPCYYPHYSPPYPTYFIPPPPPCNYPMDHHHPCYDDYYKHQNSRTHCCGCSNHVCQPRNDATPSLRIQEEPSNQPERKESDDVILPSNYAPPIIWRLPSSDSVKANRDGNDKYVGKASDKGEVGKKDPQSPSYPVIWLPGNSGFEEIATDKNPAASKSAQEQPSNFKFVPMKLLENGSHARPESEVQRVAPAVDKTSSLRTIPVKKVDGEGNVNKAVEVEETNQSSNFKNTPLECAEKGKDRILEKDIQQEAQDPVEKKGIKVRTIPVKHEESSDKRCQMASDKDKKENTTEGKEGSKTNSISEKKKPSTTKSSKLPPVCLRVDPRPKKTLANDSSTSKPTAAAAAISTMGAKNSKESSSGNGEPILEKMIPINIVNACNQNEPAISVNTVKDNKLGEDRKEQASTEPVTVASSENNASMDDSSKVSKVISEESSVKNNEKTIKENLAETIEQNMNVDEEKAVEPSEKTNEKSSSKRMLSDTDAAIVIQSAYRGFQVRRWHPLEKLKKIAEVRKETENVRRQVKDLEACPPSQLDAKQKVVLGETIMNLLLQLDTLQGLHPSVKEVRKSLAYELTTLEDKVDSIYRRLVKEAGSSKCESNNACSALDTLKLESSERDSLDDTVTASAAELRTKHDDGAIAITASTAVCEVPCEQNAQADDNGRKNMETTQDEKLPILKDIVEEEETGEVVKHPCSESDANPSNVSVHQAEDERATLRHDDICDIKAEEKDNTEENKETGLIVVGPADNEEQHIDSHELPNVNIALDDACRLDGNEPGKVSKCEASIVCSSPGSSLKPDSMDDNTTISGDDGVVAASSNQQDVPENHETIEEEKPTFFKEEEISKEVKHPCSEREMDSTVSSDSVEDMNSSDVLEHRVEDKQVALKEDKISVLEEEGHSEENKETDSIVEMTEGFVEPSIASNEPPSNNDASSRVVESLDGEEERSIADEAKGDSIVVGNESENTTESAVVDEDKQVVSEGFDAPRNMEDVCIENVEMDSKNDDFISEETKETDSTVEKPEDSIQPNIASNELPSNNDASNRAVESLDGEEKRSVAVDVNGDSIVIGNESENTSESAVVDEDKQVVSEGFDAPRNMEDVCIENVEIDSKIDDFISEEGSNVTIGKEVDEVRKGEVQVLEENEKLREMIEKLVQSGNKQLEVIDNLNGRVRDLEKKLQQTKKRRMKVRRNRAVKNRSSEVGNN